MPCTLRLLLVAMILFAATSARGSPCPIPGQSPFADVPDNAIFCTDALWLRNALVTFGCGNGTTYCPSDPVPRAQMALFMRRLATAVKPDVVYADSASTTGDLDGGGHPTCITSQYVIPGNTPNPRILTHAIGTVSILANAAATIYVLPQMSINGGTFVTLGSVGATSITQVQPNQWTAVPIMAGSTMFGASGGVPLTPGNTYQWRILMLREVGGGTGEVTFNRCQLLINLQMDSSG